LYVRKNWVKISLVCLVLVALGVTLAGCSKPKTEEESTGYPEPGSKGTIVLATTTSFRDSGLAEVLVKEMEKSQRLHNQLSGSGVWCHH